MNNDTCWLEGVSVGRMDNTKDSCEEAYLGLAMPTTEGVGSVSLLP